jgi:aspartate/methionine/tyrosine aminotransferase
VAEAVMSEEESMHEYQDNGSPGVPDFSERFVQAHLTTDLSSFDLSFLPTPGSKSMLGLIPLACGAGTNAFYPSLDVWTTTNPGYPTPADWCKYLCCYVRHMAIELNPANQFRFSPMMLREAIVPNLLMMNYPHNPSGQVANRKWLKQLCAEAEKQRVRLFNDAAYAILAHTPDHCTLAEVAKDFPDLSWVEAFSASKVIRNGTGWRIGAMVGSPDFIGDIATIKGNTDSGFAAPMAAGVLYALEHDRASVDECRKMYGQRIDILVSILMTRGMELAVKPSAGFFTLWLTPKFAFGREIKSAEEFNFLMAENPEIGVMGVDFDPYIRYSVTGDIEAMAYAIDKAFTKAKVSYE